jgi:AraC-like DNA-binding protein
VKGPPPPYLHLPPAGRPRWVCPEQAQLDLLYLGWGLRYYGRNPIPISRHHGWVYALVVRGRPQLCAIGTEIRARPGQLFVIHPDCATGWSDVPNGRSELMTWLWSIPPSCPDIAPPTRGFRQFSTGAPLRRRLQRIHRACRAGVETPDALTKLAIQQAHLELDIGIARALRPKAPPQHAEMRLEMSLRWLAQNLAEAKPVGALCEYLQVSPITLNRLFRTHLQESVASHHLRLKMDRGREMLAAGYSVKETGYILGYRHPNDFSRAMKRHSGRNPASFMTGGPG